jgi:hypothetical protein
MEATDHARLRASPGDYKSLIFETSPRNDAIPTRDRVEYNPEID